MNPIAIGIPLDPCFQGFRVISKIAVMVMVVTMANQGFMVEV